MSYLYFRNPSDGEVYAYDSAEETQLPYIQKAQEENWEDMTGNWPPAQTEDPQLVQVKVDAQMFLFQTDYTQLPDVSAKLTNESLAEFVAYREAVRDIFINPTVNPQWPTKPNAVWK